MNSTVLEVKDLHKKFKKNFWSKDSVILKGVNFSIPKGSVTGFLGANGSGKTTTFKCCLNLIKKDQGEVLFFGLPLSSQSRSKLGFLPERIQLYEDLTAEECLLFLGQLSKYRKKDLKHLIHQWLKKVDLYLVKDKKLKTFSKGMIQKIGILQALIPNSEFVILDEPFSGLDPDGRFAIFEIIQDMKNKGLTVFLSSHILQDVEKVCDRLIVIKEGSIIFEGDFIENALTQKAERNISYIQNNQKKILTVSDQEKCQKELKRILLEGGSILSVSFRDSHLERIYKTVLSKK